MSSSSNNARSSNTHGERRMTVPHLPSSARPRAMSGRDIDNDDDNDEWDAPALRKPRSPKGSTSPRRAVSGPYRSVDGGSNSSRERRAERINVFKKESLIMRTRSPVKSFDDASYRPDKKREKDRSRPGTSHRAAPNSFGAGKRDYEGSQDPWNPQVSLIPHTTAPLAPRITIAPLASDAPQSLQPPHLNQLSLAAQESAMLEDLTFVFMGFEGQYIRFANNYNPSEDKDRLAGPEFRILSGLDPSLRDLTTTMLKMATHYSAIEAFVDVQSREEFGAVNHALCAAIRKILKDYLILVAQIEHQIFTNQNFTLHQLHLYVLPTSRVLSELYSVAHEILRKNSLLEEDLEDSSDEFDDVERVLESLREGGDLGPGNIPGKKICKGGGVLGLLTKRLASMSGDPAARDLLTTLLREASRPYMDMLNEWLHRGGIRDPHGEFLIREQKSIRREKLEEDYTDEYWEKRYTIREQDIPPQLESAKEKVLLAGKYLNVVRECGGVDISKEVKDIPKTFDDPRFLENVNAAYAYANASLLNLLLTTHALPARLRSLKHYFFLDRSDFFSYFLELGASELKKPARGVNVGKLQSLLDLVLRQPGSVAAQDPFKEDVKVQMNEVSLTKWLMRVVSVSGIDQDAPGGGLDSYQAPAALSADEDKNNTGFSALELDYSVPFPLSLVISRKTVLRYQLLFRYLLSLRHLEALLVNCWIDHNMDRSWKHKSSNPRLERWKRRAWTLRARMLVFVQQLLYFSTAEVIEPNWQSLMARLDDGREPGSASTFGSNGNTGSRNGAALVKQPTRTVDELMQDHVDFLDTCLKECMLTNSKLLKIHSKVMTTCTMFATYTAYLSRSLVSADPDLCAGSSPALSSSSSRPGSSAAHSHANNNNNNTNANLNANNAPTYDPHRIDKLMDILVKYEDNFSRHLKILLDALNYYAATETVVLLGLCARLSAATDGGGASAT
ncbi:putative spindle pole body component [Xylona heveae TC161]|uniref:Spindle pole body component n=1 Tax=Xylona heveae (strain CBS 132557 / TC161) TaxID=1328760 RepID=A0A165ITG9_XYLHT|nr:putative spindle pole body component [Xylona heveae TC161]KZF25365.1 putative spindle pole body component [Xylona heveae TC161]